MKRIITIIAIAFLTTLLFNNVSEASTFKIKLWNETPFTLYFDDVEYSCDNRYKLQNISAGRHYVEVVKEVTGHGHGHCNSRQILYSGYVQIPAYSKVKARISRYNDLVVWNIEPMMAYNCMHGDFCYDWHDGCNNYYHSSHHNSHNVHLDLLPNLLFGYYDDHHTGHHNSHNKSYSHGGHKAHKSHGNVHPRNHSNKTTHHRSHVKSNKAVNHKKQYANNSTRR